jgi:hypothetical protein
LCRFCNFSNYVGSWLLLLPYALPGMWKLIQDEVGVHILGVEA